MTDALFDNGTVQLYQADARSLPIPDNSVDCVVTSPPYWGLRDYGLGHWVGGDSECSHQDAKLPSRYDYSMETSHISDPSRTGTDAPRYRSECPLCSAKRIDHQIGLEPTPDEFCANMVAVFREVWRVLKPTGTVWMNLGDSYVSQPAGNSTMAFSIKPKDLVGIPWRVAFALQADGWYLRSDIIWSKPNPMPESVTDRPTKAHEYIFLLTKSPRYYYDADAIREINGTEASWDNYGGKGLIDHPTGDARHQVDLTMGGSQKKVMPNATHPNGRNKRSVWEITTQAYPEAHFATYPEKLVEPCVLAGTSEKGVCAECGKPWERLLDTPSASHDAETKSAYPEKSNASRIALLRQASRKAGAEYASKKTTVGWDPTCDCNVGTVPATVLDPFAGSGTTLAVAQKLGRRAIGTDLSEEYLKLAAKRISKVPYSLL